MDNAYTKNNETQFGNQSKTTTKITLITNKNQHKNQKNGKLEKFQKTEIDKKYSKAKLISNIIDP